MSFQDILSSLGLSGLTVGELVSMAEMGLLAGSGILFACSIILCMLAFRAAGAAQAARRQAEIHFRSAQDLAVEVRHLTAQVEKATTRRASSVPAAPIRVGAKETTEEAEVEIVADNAAHGEHQEATAETLPAGEQQTADAAADPRLEEATRSATVPSALLMRRRRRF